MACELCLEINVPPEGQPGDTLNCSISVHGDPSGCSQLELDTLFIVPIIYGGSAVNTVDFHGTNSVTMALSDNESFEIDLFESSAGKTIEVSIGVLPSHTQTCSDGIIEKINITSNEIETCLDGSSISIIDEFRIVNDRKKFTLKMIGTTGSPCFQTIPYIFFLSYLGGSGINGIDFLAPREVTVPPGETEVEFDICVPIADGKDCYIEVNCANDFFNMPSNLYVDLSYDGLGTISSPYNPCGFNDDEEIVVPEPIKDIIECCEFYDKTHETWRDYYPTCMGSNGMPQFPGNLKSDGTQSYYDWYA